MIKVCSHGSGEPRAGELGNLFLQSIFFFLDLVHTWSGLPGKLVQITRFGGLTYLYVKAAVCGNPPNQG